MGAKLPHSAFKRTTSEDKVIDKFLPAASKNTTRTEKFRQGRLNGQFEENSP
jgi:hypothetical protein